MNSLYAWIELSQMTELQEERKYSFNLLLLFMCEEVNIVEVNFLGLILFFHLLYKFLRLSSSQQVMWHVHLIGSEDVL